MEGVGWKDGEKIQTTVIEYNKKKFLKRIISRIFSDHNGMKLEINYKKKTEKHTNI